LDHLTLTELHEFSPLFAEDVHVALSLEQTLSSKSQVGGTAPKVVASALAAARQYLNE